MLIIIENAITCPHPLQMAKGGDESERMLRRLMGGGASAGGDESGSKDALTVGSELDLIMGYVLAAGWVLVNAFMALAAYSYVVRVRNLLGAEININSDKSAERVPAQKQRIPGLDLFTDYLGGLFQSSSYQQLGDAKISPEDA
jgi:hypothetical protein